MVEKIIGNPDDRVFGHFQCCGMFDAVAWFAVEFGSIGDDRVVILHMATLLAGIVGMLLQVSRPTEARSSVSVILSVGLSACAGLWSVCTVGAVVWSASSVSGGQPYCLMPTSLKGPVVSWAELRGFSFYVMKDHEEPTFARHFNGLMVVGGAGSPRRYFEWMPLAWRFEAGNTLGDENMPTGRGCEIAENFASGLAIAR